MRLAEVVLLCVDDKSSVMDPDTVPDGVAVHERDTSTVKEILEPDLVALNERVVDPDGDLLLEGVREGPEGDRLSEGDRDEEWLNDLLYPDLLDDGVGECDCVGVGVRERLTVLDSVGSALSLSVELFVPKPVGVELSETDDELLPLVVNSSVLVDDGEDVREAAAESVPKLLLGERDLE